MSDLHIMLARLLNSVNEKNRLIIENQVLDILLEINKKEATLVELNDKKDFMVSMLQQGFSALVDWLNLSPGVWALKSISGQTVEFSVGKEGGAPSLLIVESGETDENNFYNVWTSIFGALIEKGVLDSLKLMKEIG